MFALNKETKVLIEIKEIKVNTLVIVHPFNGRVVEVPKELYDLSVTSLKDLDEIEEKLKKEAIERCLKNPEKVERVIFLGDEIIKTPKILALIEEYGGSKGYEKQMIKKEIMKIAGERGRGQGDYNTFGGCYV